MGRRRRQTRTRATSAARDFQVKVRGFRIELGEIDAALAAFPGVEFAVTLGRKNDQGQTVLVSYLLPQHAMTVDNTELLAELGKALPPHMMPGAIVQLDEVPLTPVGKLDRKALPAPVFESKPYRAPVSYTEQTVARVFSDLLGVDRVGIDDDFFELGGQLAHRDAGRRSVG